MVTNDLVGKTIGGYRLVEVIGAGSLAVVYKAYQPDLERWVAVKVLHFKQKTTLKRFQREARAVALLRHRNILILHEYGEDGDWPYIVMEYVEGGTLKDRLTGEPMDWAGAVNIIIPIGEALHYAHKRGIIHRDVKPSNILMPQEDWPLLADFGMVKLPNQQEALTRTGAPIGTPAYIAPEQARGTAIDHRVDVYSLGAVLFEMITGRLPFDYENANKILLAHIADPPPSPIEFNPECPPSLERVILTTMQKPPDDRYTDMQALVDALKNTLASSKERPVFYRSPHPNSQAPVDTLTLSDVSDAGDSAEQPKPLAPTQKARIFLIDQRATIYIPEKDSVIIGRTHGKTTADIDLGPHGGSDLGISRHHARLTKDKNDWLLDDLGSLNGTFVNDVQVDPGSPVRLRDNDIIRCSHMSFLFLVSPRL